MGTAEEQGKADQSTEREGLAGTPEQLCPKYNAELPAWQRGLGLLATAPYLLVMGFPLV